MALKLFQQNPKVEKYKPGPIVRSVDRIDMDRKEELEKFRRWLEGVAKEKSELPDKKELKKLNDEVTKGRSNKFGLLGVLAALPLAGLALGIGSAGLPSVATSATSAITGGISAAGAGAVGGGLKLFGLGKGLLKGGIMGALGVAGLGVRGIRKVFGGKPAVKPANNINNFSRPSTNRPASAAPRSNVAGNQVRGGGQQYRDNLNRSQTNTGTSTPRRPSGRARFNAGLETGTNFGGRGSAAQKKLFKLQQRLKKMFSGKNPIQGFMAKMFGSKAGRKGIGMFLKKFVTRIPFIGALIDFALQVFVFKEHPGRAAFKAIGSGLGMWIGGGVGAFLGAGFASWITGPIGAFLGGAGGDAFGSWVYDSIFGNPSASASAPDPKGEGNILDQLLGGDAAAGELPAQPLSGEVPTGSGGLTNIVSVDAMTGKSDPGGPIMTSGRGMRRSPTTGRMKMHRGIDIGTGRQKGWYVAFRMSGVVSDTGSFPGYGLTVVLTCGGKDFLFAHLAQITVQKGQRYNGEIIGEIGNTGAGTGEHLHFEVSPAGTGGYSQDQDPMPYVQYLVIGRKDPNASGNVDTVNPGSETLNAAGQVETPRQPQQQPNMMDNVVKKLTQMFGGSAASAAIDNIKETFKVLGYVNDKELMDSLVINEDGSVSRNKTEEPVPTDSLNPFRVGASMDNLTTPQMQKTVEMLSPEAEASLNNTILIMQGQPPTQAMSGGGGIVPMPVASSQPPSQGMILGGGIDNRRVMETVAAQRLT